MITYIKENLGGGYFEENRLICFAVKGQNIIGRAVNKIFFYPYNSRYVFAHEVGHALGLLGDEYEGSRPAPDIDFVAVLDNIDLKPDSTHIKWKRSIGLLGYEGISIFRGGMITRAEVYRPTENSIMRSSQLLSFNAPPREALARKFFS